MEGSIEELLQIEPYSLIKLDKEKMLTDFLGRLTQRHDKNCREYHCLLENIGWKDKTAYSYYDLPMLPVRLFKDYELMSVPRESVKKVMTSSGTSSQNVSKVFLDAENIRNQSAVLAHLISSFIGKMRLPMIILDTKLVKKDMLET